MEQLPVATSLDTVQAILDRAQRPSVPLRLSFFRTRPDGGEPPLSRIVQAHDDRALDLYLLILAQASGGNYDVTHPAAVWARALGMPSAGKQSAISKAVSRLVRYGLIERNRSGRLARIKLLKEDGSGEGYVHPGSIGTDNLSYREPTGTAAGTPSWICRPKRRC